MEYCEELQGVKFDKVKASLHSAEWKVVVCVNLG